MAIFTLLWTVCLGSLCLSACFCSVQFLYFQSSELSPFDPFYLLNSCLFLLLLLDLCTQHCSTGETALPCPATQFLPPPCDVQSEVTSLLFLSMSRQLANGPKLSSSNDRSKQQKQTQSLMCSGAYCPDYSSSFLLESNNYDVFIHALDGLFTETL